MNSEQRYFRIKTSRNEDWDRQPHEQESLKTSDRWYSARGLSLGPERGGDVNNTKEGLTKSEIKR